MIRPYENKDFDQLIDVWYRSFIHAHPFIDQAFVEKVKVDMGNIYIPNAKTWVFVEKDILKGFISMLGNEIGGLFVDPEIHSKGIGTQLVKYINTLHPIMEVEVFKKNSIGRAFYDKYGFKLIKEYYHEESKHDILRLKTNSK